MNVQHPMFLKRVCKLAVLRFAKCTRGIAASFANIVPTTVAMDLDRQLACLVSKDIHRIAMYRHFEAAHILCEGCPPNSLTNVMVLEAIRADWPLDLLRADDMFPDQVISMCIRHRSHACCRSLANSCASVHPHASHHRLHTFAMAKAMVGTDMYLALECFKLSGWGKERKLLDTKTWPWARGGTNVPASVADLLAFVDLVPKITAKRICRDVQQVCSSVFSVFPVVHIPPPPCKP